MALIGIAATDRELDIRVTTFVYYCIPVFLVSWIAGLRGGLALAALACLFWGWANVVEYSSFRDPRFGWAVFARAVTFVVAVLYGGALESRASWKKRAGIAERRARSMARWIIEIVSTERLKIVEELRLLQSEVSLGNESNKFLSGNHAEWMPALANRIGGLVDGLTWRQSSGERFSSLMERLSKDWSKSIGIWISWRGCEVEFPGNVQEAEYLIQIVREAVRHALNGRARSVELSSFTENGDWYLCVEDDGNELGGDFPGESLFVSAICADLFGAELKIVPVVPRGRRLTCKLPLRKPSLSVGEAKVGLGSIQG